MNTNKSKRKTSSWLSTPALILLFPVMLLAAHHIITIDKPADINAEGANIRNLQRALPNAKKGDTAAVRFNNGWGGDYTKKGIIGTLLWSQDRLYILGDCDGCSPLLLDMDQNGFLFDEPGVGVEFDILGSGTPKLLQWVASGTKDAFLARDINENGHIDDGSEIFGMGTDIILGGGKASDGYEALAQFDAELLGGDGDGKISRKDQVWGELLLWTDNNADGISQKQEVVNVSETNIEWLSLQTRKSRFADEAGNTIHEWSWVKTDTNRGLRRLKMVDVYFKSLD